MAVGERNGYTVSTPERILSPVFAFQGTEVSCQRSDRSFTFLISDF
jgi:hypothetical protein